MTWLELQQELSQGFIAPVYLLYGGEDYLLEQAVNALRNRLLPPEAQLFDYQELAGAEVAPESLLAAAYTPPALAEKRLLLLRNAPLDNEGLLSYLERPSPTTCLVLIAEGEIDKRKKAFKKIQEMGRVIEFAPLKPAALAGWLKQEAKKLGRRMENPAAQALVQVASNLYQALTELNKLDLYLPPGSPITLKDVQTLTPDTLAADAIFHLVDALGNGQASLAVSLCRKLLAAGEAPLAILGMMVRQFRLILQAKIAALPVPDLAKLLNVPPFVAQKIVRQSERFSLETVARVLESLLKTDTAIKTGAGDPASLLEHAIWDITKRKGTG